MAGVHPLVSAVCGLGFKMLADSVLGPCVFSLSALMGLPTLVLACGFGLAAMLCACGLGLSVGVRLGFGDLSHCSSLLFPNDSPVGERDIAGILLFCRSGLLLSSGDISGVSRVLVDLPAPGFPPPLVPLLFLFPPCSFEVSVAWRGFLGEARLRLKFGSATQLRLGSVLPRESESCGSPGLRRSDWTTSFPCFDAFGEVSMSTGSEVCL